MTRGMATARLAVPGPSFVREEPLELHARPGHEGNRVRLGMSRPSVLEDGWWLARMWAFDDEGVLDLRSVAPLAGPPPTPPLLVLGPAFAGAVSGLVAQEDGRQLIRLKLPPAPDESRPWERPLIVWLAVTWDPVRAAVMTANELAREALVALGRALLAAGRAA